MPPDGSFRDRSAPITSVAPGQLHLGHNTQPAPHFPFHYRNGSSTLIYTAKVNPFFFVVGSCFFWTQTVPSLLCATPPQSGFYRSLSEHPPHCLQDKARGSPPSLFLKLRQPGMVRYFTIFRRASLLCAFCCFPSLAYFDWRRTRPGGGGWRVLSSPGN